jgi:hypothetical protein
MTVAGGPDLASTGTLAALAPASVASVSVFEALVHVSPALFLFDWFFMSCKTAAAAAACLSHKSSKCDFGACMLTLHSVLMLSNTSPPSPEALL